MLISPSHIGLLKQSFIFTGAMNGVWSVLYRNELRPATEIAGSILPTASDLLNSGLSESFLIDHVNGCGTGSMDYGKGHNLTGLNPRGRYEFAQMHTGQDGPTSSSMHGPATLDVWWRVLTIPERSTGVSDSKGGTSIRMLGQQLYGMFCSATQSIPNHGCNNAQAYGDSLLPERVLTNPC